MNIYIYSHLCAHCPFPGAVVAGTVKGDSIQRPIFDHAESTGALRSRVYTAAQESMLTNTGPLFALFCVFTQIGLV